MEGISKELLQELHDIAVRIGDLIRAQVLSDLIKACKELPQGEWQTIEEFNKNPIVGWCWISYGIGDEFTDIAYYVNRVFYWNDMTETSHDFNDVDIIHVMTIKTPAAPK